MYRFEHAFTLLEVMMALAVAALLVVLSISGVGIYQRYKIRDTALLLVHAIGSARALAIRLQQPVQLCTVNSMQQCQPSWQGKLVLRAVHSKITTVVSSIPKNLHISFKASYGRNDAVYFDSMGFVQQQGTFVLQAKKNLTAPGYCVELRPWGAKWLYCVDKPLR